MPNWVYSNLQASGTIADIQAFLEKAGKPHTTEFTGKRYQDENGEWKYDADAIVVQEDTDPFSFWNFVRPEEEILPVYFGHEKSAKPEGYEAWSMEEKFAHDLKFTGNNSYDWNIRNWGTKWDACDQSVDEPFIDEKAGTASVSVSFSTAWSIPEPVLIAIVAQHPELEFSIESEEEQGWGAEYKASTDDSGERSLELVREWDIPDCHQDYVDRDRDCWACESGDEDDLYEDCPREETDFVVVVERRYIVKAQTAEKAWELAQDQLETLTPEDLDVSWVIDENSGQRLFPVLEGSEA